MLKTIFGLVAALCTTISLAAVDVNRANAAELDSIKGVGPALSGKILDERKSGAFKDWDDLISRVKGIKQKNATKLSSEGLTVNDAGYREEAVTPASDAARTTKN